MNTSKYLPKRFNADAPQLIEVSKRFESVQYKRIKRFAKMQSVTVPDVVRAACDLYSDSILESFLAGNLGIAIHLPDSANLKPSKKVCRRVNLRETHFGQRGTFTSTIKKAVGNRLRTRLTKSAIVEAALRYYDKNIMSAYLDKRK